MVMPQVLAFLGYDPLPEPITLSERMRAYRNRHGLSIAEAALRLGVDEGSWGLWERTGEVPWKRYRVLLEEFLADEHREVTTRIIPDDVVP